MSALASELRHIRKELVRLNRKAALARLPGKVDEVRQQNGDWQVRLDLGEDPATGRKTLSPWVRVQPGSAGDMKIKVKPTKGEQMYLMNASGVVGADSMAIWGAFDDEHKAPDGDHDLVIERGKARFTIKDGRLAFEAEEATITVGDNILHMTSERIETVGRTFVGLETKGEDAPKIVTEGGPARKAFAKA